MFDLADVFKSLAPEARTMFYNALIDADIAHQLHGKPRHKIIKEMAEGYSGKVKKLLRYLSKKDQAGTVVNVLFEARREFLAAKQAMPNAGEDRQGLR